MVEDAFIFRNVKKQFESSIQNNPGDILYLDKAAAKELLNGHGNVLTEVHLPKFEGYEKDYVYFLTLKMKPDTPKRNTYLKDPNADVTITDRVLKKTTVFNVPSTDKLKAKITQCKGTTKASEPWVDLSLTLAQEYVGIMEIIKKNLDLLASQYKAAYEEITYYLEDITDIANIAWLEEFVSDPKIKSLSAPQHADIKKKLDAGITDTKQYKTQIDTKFTELANQLKDGAAKITNMVRSNPGKLKPIGESFKKSLGLGYGKTIGEIALYKLRNKKNVLKRNLNSILN